MLLADVPRLSLLLNTVPHELLSCFLDHNKSHTGENHGEVVVAIC